MIEDKPTVEELLSPQARLLTLTALLGHEGEVPAHHAMYVERGIAIVKSGAVLPVIEGKTSARCFIDRSPSKLGDIFDTSLEPEGSIKNSMCINSTGNYLHFLANNFPSLLFLKHTPGERVKLLMCGNFPTSMLSWITAFLPSLAGGRSVDVSPLEDGCYYAENVIFPFAASKPFFPGLLARQIILPYAFKHAGLADPLAECGSVKIFIRREGGNNGRNLINQTEVEKWFASRGFISVNPGTMSFEEQVVLFARATHIAGVEGAAFANILFAIHAQQIVMIASAAVATDRFQFRLVKNWNVPFTAIYGQPLESGRNADFYIPLEDLSSLDSLITAST